MRYDTMNEVGPDGSSSPFDLHDNAGNIDVWANDRTKISSPDRLGVQRKTFFGMEQQVNDFLAAQGYEPVPLEYVDGSPLTVDRSTQLIERDGNLYSIKLPASFPVTLTGNWSTDQNLLVAQVDRSLRQQLADPLDPTAGAALVARAIRHINSLAELRLNAGRYDGETVWLRGRTEGVPGQGAGNFVYSATSTAADDDGYVISSGGVGRWIRQFDGNEINAGWYGASVSSTSAVNTAAIQAAVNIANALGISSVRLPGKGVLLSAAITAAAAIAWSSNGAFFSDYLFVVNQDRVDKKIPLPSQFSWIGSAWAFYANGIPGGARTTATVDSLWKANEIQGSVNYYVDPVGGSDSNTGTTIGSPLKTVSSAIAKANVGIINIMPGVHYGGFGGAIGTTVMRDIVIRTWTGGNDVVVRNSPDPASQVWTLVSGTASTYSTTPGATISRVVDRTIGDSIGDFAELQPQTSQAAVTANPGSFYYDSSSGLLYIRRHRSTAPGTDLLTFFANKPLLVTGRAVLLKNLQFEGGGGVSVVDSSGTRGRLYAVDVTVKYQANNGIDSMGSSTYCERCTVSRSLLDNFNYHDNNGSQARALEIDCTSYFAGDWGRRGWQSVTESQNASTMHDTGSVIRINGMYRDSFGPVIPDTGASSSMNIGITAQNSLATTGQNTSIYSDGGMYLIDSLLRGSTYDIRSASGGTVYVRNLQVGGAFLRESGGKIQQF